MIKIPKYLDRSQQIVVRLIGVGNAGVTIADRIQVGGQLDIETIAMNTDQQSLSASVAATKISLGPLTTRGLGTGADPEIGLDCARESLSEIKDAVEGADIVFLCAGLGGGTASGTGAVLAETAREAGCLLIAILTTPFGFEGRRRAIQATNALSEISAHADAVIHFPNERMSELAAPRTGVAETFAACDELLASCVVSVANMLDTPGPMSVGVPDLLSVLRSSDGYCIFGSGSAEGGNRAFEALESAMKGPLLDHGRLLKEASSVLIHISGPSSLSYPEVAAIMQEIIKHTAESAALHMGISASAPPSAPLTISIIGKCGPSRALPFIGGSRAKKASPPLAEIHPQAPLEGGLEEQHLLAPDPIPQAKTPARPRTPQTEAKPAKEKIRQETLQFEPIARGRFEKSEPTIVEGEDLDVPTLIRLSGDQQNG